MPLLLNIAEIMVDVRSIECELIVFISFWSHNVCSVAGRTCSTLTHTVAKKHEYHFGVYE